MSRGRGSGRSVQPKLNHVQCSRLMSALNAVPGLPDEDYQFLQRCKANLAVYWELDRYANQIPDRQQHLISLANKYGITNYL